MLLHAGVAARRGAGVLLLGPPGAGKSDLLLRLIDRGFALVADDQVAVEAGVASAPAALAGLLEIRGLGIVRLPYLARAVLALAVRLEPPARLPGPGRYDILDLPMVCVAPFAASAAIVVERALDGVQGSMAGVAGAFVAADRT